MHPIQQHCDHPLQALRQGRHTLDGSTDGAVDNEKHLSQCLMLLQLPLDLSQTDLVCYPGLKENEMKEILDKKIERKDKSLQFITSTS